MKPKKQAKNKNPLSPPHIHHFNNCHLPLPTKHQQQGMASPIKEHKSVHSMASPNKKQSPNNAQRQKKGFLKRLKQNFKLNRPLPLPNAKKKKFRTEVELLSNAMRSPIITPKKKGLTQIILASDLQKSPLRKNHALSPTRIKGMSLLEIDLSDQPSTSGANFSPRRSKRIESIPGTSRESTPVDAVDTKDPNGPSMENSNPPFWKVERLSPEWDREEADCCDLKFISTLHIKPEKEERRIIRDDCKWRKEEMYRQKLLRRQRKEKTPSPEPIPNYEIRICKKPMNAPKDLYEAIMKSPIKSPLKSDQPSTSASSAPITSQPPKTSPQKPRAKFAKRLKRLIGTTNKGNKGKTRNRKLK